MRCIHDQRLTQSLQVCSSGLQFGLQTQSPMHTEELRWWSTDTSRLDSHGNVFLTSDPVFSSSFALYFTFFTFFCTHQSGCKWLYKWNDFDRDSSICYNIEINDRKRGSWSLKKAVNYNTSTGVQVSHETQWQYTAWGAWLNAYYRDNCSLDQTLLVTCIY